MENSLDNREKNILFLKKSHKYGKNDKFKDNKLSL